MEVRAIPGVSSLSYLCARLRTTWQDAFVVSAHGRAHNAAGAVRTHAKTFLLTGGSTSAQDICAQLCAQGLGEVRVHVGERLSYKDERIVCGTARELAERAFGSLAAMFVLNERPLAPEVRAPELPDDAFVRGKVPMTKQEVRQLAICKLAIRPADTVWDVGAGTGSVSVEAARAACAGQVLAVERADEAVALIEENRARFGLSNLHVVHGCAPEALAGLDAPDRVFVGGSSGSLEGILRAALAANPAVRLCVAAVTLETVSSALACVQALDLREVDICQVGIARAHEAGAYHLMRAQNPVYLIAAEGPGAPPSCGGGGVR
jgi:precorrin-6Y C5,15-methyltransferase (decarboxylating)